MYVQCSYTIVLTNQFQVSSLTKLRTHLIFSYRSAIRLDPITHILPQVTCCFIPFIKFAHQAVLHRKFKETQPLMPSNMYIYKTLNRYCTGILSRLHTTIIFFYVQKSAIKQRWKLCLYSVFIKKTYSAKPERIVQTLYFKHYCFISFL